MFNIYGASIGLLVGLLCYSNVTAEEAAHCDELIVIVELSEWLNATKQLIGENAEIRCWKNERPDWFKCDTTSCRKILILTNPSDQQMTKELWRERLQNQGCHIYPVKLAKSHHLKNQSDLLRRLHRSLVECSPENRSLLDENLKQALQRLSIRHPVANLSTSESVRDSSDLN